jgi:hypothetical protein
MHDTHLVTIYPLVSILIASLWACTVHYPMVPPARRPVTHILVLEPGCVSLLVSICLATYYPVSVVSRASVWYRCRGVMVLQESGIGYTPGHLDTWYPHTTLSPAPYTSPVGYMCLTPSSTGPDTRIPLTGRGSVGSAHPVRQG